MIEDQLDMNNLPIDRPGRRSTVAEQLGVAPTESKFLQATSGRLDTFAEEPMSNQESFQFFPNQDREDIRARYQSVPELFGKALWNSAVEIGAGAAEGVGYLADVKGIWDSFTQQETEYGNWFSDMAKQAKESMSADIKLTQEAREGFAPTDATWWASNAPSVASAISLAIPAMGAVRGLTAISKIGSLGRVNKLVKSVGTANKIAGTSSAVLSRYMENTMEASETFDSTYNELISQGLSDEDAKAKAGLAARDSWNSNWVNLAFDVVQFNMLGKGVNAANINSKDLAKSLGKSMVGKGAALAGNMVQEGVEEGIQYVVGQEAKRAQTEEGAAYFDKGLFESFSEYIDDPEMKTSMFFGALGGGVFNAGGGAIDAHFKKKSDKLADAYLEKQKALDSNDYTKASDIDTSEFMQTAYAHAETGKMNDFKDKLTVELNKTDAELAAEGKNESQIAEHRKIFQNLVEDADYVGSEFSRIQDVRGKDNKLKQKELFTLYHRRVKERSLADINEKIGKVKAGATLPMMEAIELSSLNVFEAIRINTTNKNQKIDNHERVGEVVKRRKKQLQDSLEASAKAMDLSVDEYIKTLPVAEAELQKMIAQKVSTQMTLESLNGTLKDINDPTKEADVLNNINNTRKEAILATISPEMGIDQLNQFISDPQVSKDVIAKVDELTKDANKHIPSGDNVYGQIDRRYNGSNLALSKDLKNIAFLTSDIKNIEDFKTKYSNNNLFKQAVDSYYKSLLKDTASSGVTFGEDVDSNANQPDDEDSFLPSQSKTLTFDVSVVANNDTALVRLSSDNPSIVEVIGYKIDGIDPVKGITRIPLSSAEKLFKLKSINSSRWNILYDIDGRVISSQNNIIELEDGTTIPLMTVEEQQNLDNPDFSFKGKQIRLETVPNAKWGKKKGFDKMLILVKYEHEGQWLTAGMLKSINKNASTPIEQKILDIRQNIFNSQETTFDFDIKIKERTTGNIVKGMDQPVTALLAAGQPLMLGVILPNEDGTYQISYGGSIDIDTSLVEYNPSSMMGYYEGNTVTFIKTPKGTYVPMKLKTAKLSEFPDELNKVYKLIESFKEGDDIVELNSNLQELTFLTLKRLSDNTWSYEFLKNTGEKGYSEPMTQEALFNYIKENKAIRINKDKINNGNYNASVAKFLRSDITLAPLKTRGASLVLSFDKVNLGTIIQPVIQEVKPLELKPVVVNTPLDDTIVATENTQDLLEIFNLPDTTSAVMADVPVKATEVVVTEEPAVSDIETQKADIERIRQEAYRAIDVMADPTFAKLQSKLTGLKSSYALTPGKRLLDEINDLEIAIEKRGKELAVDIDAKYDAELAALETPQAGSVGVEGDVVEVKNIGGKPFNGTTLSTGKNPFEVNSKNEVEVADKKRAMASINGALSRLYDWKEYPNDGNSSITVIKKPIVSFDSNGEVVIKQKGEIVFDAELKAVEQSLKEAPTVTEDIEVKKAEIENEKSIAVKELLQSQEKQREQAKKEIKEVTDTGSSDAGSTNRGNIALLGTLDNAVRRLEDTFDKRLNDLLTNDEKINDIEIAYVYFSDYKKYELQTKDLNRRDKKRISILIDRIGDSVVETLLKDNKINRDKEDSNLFKDLNGKNLGNSASVVKILYGKNSPTVREIKDKLIAELNTLEQSAPTATEVKKDIDPNTGKEKISRTRRNRVANNNVTEVWNKEVEMAWFKKNYPNTPISVLADLSHIAETGGIELWGMYENAAIYMAENAGRGTLYHEAFHLVFNSMLTEKERISLLKQVKVKGTALDKEEFLSDGFSDHMLNEKLSEGLSDSIRDFFKRLYHIISIVAERLGLKKDATIDEMFYRASKGIYNNFPRFKRDVTMFKKNLYGELNPSEATSAAKIIADSIINEVIPSLREKYNKLDAEDVDILNMSMAKDKKGDADGYSIKGLFKTVYDFLQSDYEELPDGSFDKEVLGRVIKSMLTENADGTITYRALMQLAISKLSSYGLKLNPNGFDTIERTIDETIEETDTDEVGESKVKESYGNSDKFTSAKDNFRGRSLRLMSSIPFANKTFASKQMYHEFSYIYSTLQEELVDSVSIEQMMEKLEDLYSITPEFRMISDEFVKDPTLKTEFWNNFGQRISAPFRTIKKERDGNFHTFETNRVGVKRDIISDWQYFFENNNDLYNETEGVKDIPGIKEDIDFLNNLSKIYNNELRRDDGLDSDDIVRLSEVLFKIGIPFNEPKLRSVLSLNSEESTKSGARLAIDLIKGYDNKGLLFVLNQLANKKSPFVDSIDSVKATQSVASILVKMFPTMRQTSFLNGENKQVNSNVAPRQSFRFVNLLKSSKQRADAILTERMKDPFFSRMPLFKMIKEEDRLRQKMSLEIFDTLKDVKGKGIPYSTLTRRQFDAIRFNMWYNRAKDFTKDGNTIYGKETNDAFYGLPIPSDSTSYTAFKFVKLTHSEARKGIIYAVRQEYDRILDLQNKITPYQKEYDAWRNGTLSNQDLPSALKKIPYSLLANGLNYHIFPALNGQTITDYNLTEKVNPLIDQVIKDEISSLIKEGVIDAAFTNVNGSLDARIFAEKFDTKSLIEQYVLNSMFMNTQLTFMFGNDIAYYKPAVKKVGSNKTKTGEVQTEDFFKRIKQIWSPGTYLDTNAKFIDEAGVTHGVRESYKVAYIEDVEIPSEQIQKIVGLFETEAEKAFVRDKYESMNISDAFTIIDPFRYREVMISSAQWSHAHEKQYNHIINGRVVPANELVVFQPIKPFMFENVWVDGKWVPTQHKNAEMLLIPQMAIGNPIFQNALEKMGWVFNADGSYRFDVSKRNVDAILFNSSVKVGEMMTLKSISDIDNSNTQSFNNNNYRIQMGTPEHFMDSNITFGTQYRKLILEGIQMSSIYTFSDGSTKTGAEIFKLYNDAIELNLSEGLSNVEKIFKNADGSINYDSMLNEIRKYVMEKDLGSDYLEALRWLDPNNKRGGTVLPFYHPSISYNLEAILNSFYKNNVTKQEANGMALYNTSSYGYSDTGKLRKPKIVFAEDGKSIKYVEAIIPIQSKELLEEFLGEDGFVDMNKVPEVLKEGLFYRIPTEDKYSMVHIRVIGYFPSQVGAQIVLPDEITTKAGLDFDIDKMYGFMMNHYKDSKTGKFNKVKSGLESKEARQNLMLDIGIAIMSHESSAASQMRPGNFDNLKEIRDEIVKAQGKSSVKLNFALPSTHTEVQSRNMTGGKLIGPFANHRVNHVLMGFGNFMIAKDRGIKFNGVEKNNLSTNTSADGKLIGSKLASFVAAVVDNAKDPLASFFNLTMTFSDTVATIVRSGHTERTALRFIAQPVMMEFTSRFSNSDNTGTLNAIALMREMIDEEYALVNDPNMVNQLIQSIELTDDNLLEQIAKENSTELTTASDKLGIVAYRIKTLGQMVEIMEVADELNKVMSAMRYDSMGKAAGPSYADTLIKVRSYDKLIKKSNLVTGLAEFNEIPWVKSFYEKGVATALERIIEVGNYPYKNEVFSDILTYFEDRKTNGSLTANEINSLIRSIMTALTSMSPIYNAKKSNELLTSFPKRFMQYKKDNPAGAYSNLTNLMSIDKAAKNDGRYSKPYDFLIFNRSGIDSQHMQSLKDTWNEMLNSPKEEERLLANDLAIYAFVTSGFVFSSNALTDLIPVTHSSEMRENVNSESVNEFMKKSFFANHSEALLNQIQNQILRNFYQSASYVKELDITKYKLQKNEGKLFFVVEDYLTDSNLVRAFYSAIKDDSGKIVSYEQDFEPIPYFRTRVDKGSIKSDPILMMPRKDPNSNRVIFMEQEPLGVPNRIVQFDLQNDIVVQVGKDNPFIEDAVYEDVTETLSQPTETESKVEPIVEIEVEETESPFLDTVSDVYGNIINSFNVSLPIINNDMDGALPETPVVKTKVEELTKEDMLNKGQKEALDKAMVVIEREVSDSIQDNMFLISGKGGCLGYGTKVLMFNGQFKEVQDVVVGDQLMGIDSTPRNVLELRSGIQQMYNIHQKKGITYKVNEEHILSLKVVHPKLFKKIIKDNKRISGTETAQERFVTTENITVKDYLQKMNNPGNACFKKHHMGYQSGLIEFSNQEIAIDPYYLGLWLGDGTTIRYYEITNTDKEIVNYFESIGIDERKGINGITYCLDKSYMKEGFKKDFNLNRYKDITKYIPDNFLHNSSEIRLKLLAGLIDSDGHYCKSGKYYEITQKNKKLAEQIVYLCRTLGFKTSIKEKDSSISGRYIGKVYRITFASDIEIPVLIERKKNKELSKFKNRLHTGIAVEKDIVDNYYGFVLDGDHLFMLEDFTVTHNTGKTYLTEVLIDKILDNNRYERIAHVAPTWNAVNEIKKASSKDDYEAITLASFLGTTLSEPDESGVQYFLLKDEKTIEEAYSKWGTIPALYTSDIIILDEASMIGGNGERPVKNQRGQIVSSDAWQTVLYRLNHRERMGLRKPKKIILVGDYAQIPPVGTSEDRDAEIMEIMMSSMNTHHVLTENMRTNKEDLHRLHELYRNNIDTARAELKNGVPSNVSIQRNPLPYDKRRNTNNIEFANNLEMAVDKFVELFNQAPSDVTNVVFINYNNYNRPETQSLINKIRIKLFRENAGLDYNENELVLLKGNLKSKIMYKGRKVEVTWHNETRFILNNVKQNAVHEFNEVVKYWENGRPMSKRIKISFNGLNANMTTEFGKEIITFNTFIPDKGEIAKVFGPYNSAKKGYVVNGETIPYGTYLKIMESMPNLEYGYVVNGHKVQGSSYNNVIVDESNIMKSPMTNKEFNNSAYTSFSRPRNYLMIYNISNPSDVAPLVSKAQVSPFANVIEIAERLFVQSSSKESKSNIAKTMEDLDRNPSLFDGLTREAYSKMTDEEKAAVVFNKLNC